MKADWREINKMKRKKTHIQHKVNSQEYTLNVNNVLVYIFLCCAVMPISIFIFYAYFYLTVLCGVFTISRTTSRIMKVTALCHRNRAQPSNSYSFAAWNDFTISERGTRTGNSFFIHLNNTWDIELYEVLLLLCTHDTMEPSNKNCTNQMQNVTQLVRSKNISFIFSGESRKIVALENVTFELHLTHKILIFSQELPRSHHNAIGTLKWIV